MPLPNSVPSVSFIFYIWDIEVNQLGRLIGLILHLSFMSASHSTSICAMLWFSISSFLYIMSWFSAYTQIISVKILFTPSDTNLIIVSEDSFSICERRLWNHFQTSFHRCKLFNIPFLTLALRTSSPTHLLGLKIEKHLTCEWVRSHVQPWPWMQSDNSAGKGMNWTKLHSQQQKTYGIS